MAAGSDPTIFNDRPGTRIRIVLPDSEAKPARPVARFFGWVSKIVYALIAGVLCAALASYVPTGGSAIAPYIPEDCDVYVHAPSGAALHRTLSESPALNQLLDDNDSAAFVRRAFAARESAPGNTDETQESKAKASEGEPATLRTQLDELFARTDLLPWYARWLAPKRVADFYPVLGGECAVACTAPKAHAAVSAAQVLLLGRVSGSRGWLLRLAAPFVKSKKVELFDLGGGLIAAGINGARPAFGPHRLSAVLATRVIQNRMPILSLACNSRALNVQRVSEDATRDALNKQIDAGDTILSRLSEEGVPDPYLYALLRPPGTGEMLNWRAPPDIVRVDFFARSAGGMEIAGTLDGVVPSLPGDSPQRPQSMAGFSPLSPGDAVAEFVLPVDLRALFIRHVAGTMKLTKGAEGLSRGQRRWIARFRNLESVGAEPDRDLWPAIGHVAKLSIHEANSDVTGTKLGAAKAWLPFKPARPDDALFCATELARVYWEFLFENDERATVKPRYVRRFTPNLPPGELFGGKFGRGDSEDRYVLATGLINAPAWSLGPNGLRITSEAGAGALLKGPDPQSFLPPPEKIDAYRVRIDGARLAPTAEALATVLYDDIEEEIGNAQKFHAQYPDSTQNVRLARKWTSLLGDLEIEVAPRAEGASLRALWVAGRMVSANAPTREKSNSDSVPPPPIPDNNAQPKSKPNDLGKSDDDDAPPPPPPPGN